MNSGTSRRCPIGLRSEGSTKWGMLLVFAGLAIIAGPKGHAFGQQLGQVAKVKPKICAATISTCGCEITKKGRYDVTADLSAAGGLTPDGDCIEIQASNVLLNLGTHAITGPGGANTDIGIDVKHGSNNDTVLGGITTPPLVTEWQTGVYIGGNNGVFSNVHADLNGVAGFELDGASSDRLTGWEANNPGGTFGLWIRNGTDNFVTDGVANSNGDSGIFVGCADVASTAGEDCKGAKKSVGNDLVNDVVDSNKNYGIALDSNASQTVVNALSGSSNGFHDLFDDSPSCGSNQWLDDSGTKSDPCIE